MSTAAICPPLPASRDEIDHLRQWNLEMLRVWRSRKDEYVRDYNMLCRWGAHPNDPQLQKWMARLTYAPVFGEPDTRLRDPRYWFMLVEEVSRQLPQNDLWHCYETLRRIRENGINHNFAAGSNQLARDAESAVYRLFSLFEALENRLVAALQSSNGLDQKYGVSQKPTDKIYDAREEAPENSTSGSDWLMAESKANTAPGDAEKKILSALSKHHKYENGSCLNMAAIGNNELARRAKVAKGSVSNFWSRKFGAGAEGGTYDDYRRACGNNCLPFILATLNGDTRPRDAIHALEQDITPAT